VGAIAVGYCRDRRLGLGVVDAVEVVRVTGDGAQVALEGHAVGKGGAAGLHMDTG